MIKKTLQKTLTTSFTHRAGLERKDLIFYEKKIIDLLRSMISFSKYSMLFPKSKRKRSASWSEQDKTLLLPLPDGQGSPLGIIVARGGDSETAYKILQAWDILGPLLVENLRLYKQSLSDPTTGLLSRHSLLQQLTHHITRGKEPEEQTGICHPPSHEVTKERPTSTHRATNTLLRIGSLGILVIRLSALRDVAREFGSSFADDLTTALADTVESCCPDSGIAARLGDLEFAVHFPAATNKTCREMADNLLEALSKTSIYNPLRKTHVRIPASVGYAVYPQDMEGRQFLRTPQEQARSILQKARLAASLAENAPAEGCSSAPVMGFNRILSRGGAIIEVLPMSRVIVNLGSAMHAREGQRFSVWGKQPGTGSSSFAAEKPMTLYKGEIVLVEVQTNAAAAEILHIGDPGWQMETGDRLLILADDHPGMTLAESGKMRPDPSTGMMKYADFMTTWVQQREKSELFCLSLIRLNQHEEQEDENAFVSWSRSHMAELAHLGKEVFGPHCLYGLFGMTSMLIFHPEQKPDAIVAASESLLKLVEKKTGFSLTIGIAPYPFLDFRKADILENAQKSLDYAALLPHPHVGVFDSVAINISADRLFSQGDLFKAIEEYKIALLADEKNTIALNSLGICFANLGKFTEAQKYFHTALEHDRDDEMAWYNLGFVQQSQKKNDKAKQLYQQCLARNPEHLYAQLRLGQIAEQAGEYQAAQKYYEKAAKIPGGKGMTYRHFARLSLAIGDAGRAREYLHEALVHNPFDASAMQLLAHIFLDAGEDPSLAASLARQSVAIRPSFKNGWLELARALEMAGEKQQAKEATLIAAAL